MKYLMNHIQKRGGSPQFEYPAAGVWNFAHVAYLFWAYMDSDYSVSGALNALSLQIYGNYFTETDLNGWLIVYGNAEMYLP